MSMPAYDDAGSAWQYMSLHVKMLLLAHMEAARKYPANGPHLQGSRTLFSLSKYQELYR